MMKLKSVVTLLTALAMGATAAFAKPEEDTPLSKEMSAMNKSLRALKKQATDVGKKAESLALVDKMKANVAAALKLEPAKTKDQPVADKPVYVDKFKEALTHLDKTYDELKDAIEKGDADAIAADFKKLGDIKEKGHKDFAPEE